MATSLSSPLAAFQSASRNGASSVVLLELLQALMTEYFTGGTTERIPASGKDTWVDAILELTECFVLKLPSPLSGSWSMLLEMVKLSQVTLDITLWAAQLVDGLFSSRNKNFTIVIICLLKFMVDIKKWSEKEESCLRDSS